MKIFQVDDPFVVHQYHTPFQYRQDLVALNTVLWEEWLASEDNVYKVDNKFKDIEYTIL